MLVSEVMTRQVVAIGPDTPIRDVQALMEHRNVRHFPILEGRAAIGLGDGVVRISIGLEGTEDLIADLDQALR